MEIDFEYCDECHELKPHHLLHRVGDKVFCKCSTNDCAKKYFERTENDVDACKIETEESESE